IAGGHVRVHGAGRTDTGVHALAQCAHVDLPSRKLAAAAWVGSLNGVLPPTIRVLRCRYVTQNFHARFSAKGKTYRYRIWAGPTVTVEVSGNGFLYKMVRLIVGTMARVALDKAEIAEIDDALRSGRPNRGRLVAPAEGLYLMRVWY